MKYYYKYKEHIYNNRRSKIVNKFNNKIDLHMHSYYSDDGEFSPTELVEKCIKNGIKIMSITDHNCIRANEEAAKFANENGIIYIPGIEIDCTFEGRNFHVLGYGIKYKNKDFINIERNIDKQCIKASFKSLEATKKIGFSITESEMVELEKHSYWKGHWTGEMFAEIILNKEEYINHPLLRPYRDGGVRSDNPYVNFYWDYYSQGKPCYVKVDYPSLEEVVEIIHRNGGKAILAHPGANLRGYDEVFQRIIKTEIDGIEVFSSYYEHSEILYYLNEAKENGKFITVGSDYHGKTKPNVKLGQIGCLINEIEIFESINNNLLYIK